jgi:hypothetical protein
MSEYLKYLENFWVPAVGSSVAYLGELASISSFASEDGVQVFLKIAGFESSKIYFIQDLEWKPQESDISGLFLRLGFVDCGDCWYLDKVFYPKTPDYELASKTLMQARARRLEFSEKDLAFL